MNLTDPDLTPAGGALRDSADSAVRQPVATFSHPAARPADPRQIWPDWSRPTTMTRGGTQGDPLGSYRPGGSIEDEPLTENERASGHVAQDAAHVTAGRQIRQALRGV